MADSANPLRLLESYDTYAANFMEIGVWRPFAQQVAQKHHLTPDEPIRTGVAGTYPTFIIADRWVVKFFGQLYWGEESYLAEWHANQLVGQYPEILAPTVIATGHLFGEGHSWHWPYLIFEFIPGISVGEVYAKISLEDKLGMAKQLGSICNRLHRISLTGTPFYSPKGWECYSRFLEAQQRICVDNHKKWESLPERLIAQIEDFLLPVDEIVDPQTPPSLIHADITRDHILGQIADGHWETKALIDFGDAMVGDLFYELVALHLDAFQCDRRLLNAFLAAYGLSNHQRKDFPRKAMSVALLHQFDVFFGLRASLSNTPDSLETFSRQLWGE